MKCPFCHSDQIFVQNSRSTSHDTQIWRRRYCQSCHQTFTTYEKVDLSYLTVVKSDGRHQRFQQSKLFVSIYHPHSESKNSDRGESAKFAEELTSKVEHTIIERKRKEITTTEILDIVLKELANHSPVSCLKYLTYRQGHHPDKFKHLVKKYLY